MSDIGELARISYDAGIHPIDYAEGQVRLLIAVHSDITAIRAADLDALPRRILGSLMDAGWTPPEVP